MNFFDIKSNQRRAEVFALEYLKPAEDFKPELLLSMIDELEERAAKAIFCDELSVRPIPVSVEGTLPVPREPIELTVSFDYEADCVCTQDSSRLYPTQNKGKVLEPDHFDYLEEPYAIHSNLNKNRIGRLLNMEFIYDQFSHGLGKDFVLMLYENRCRELY